MRSFVYSLIKNRMFYPLQIIRFVRLNLITQSIVRAKRKFLVPSPKTIVDMAKDAHIYLNTNVELGWCNMRRTNIETGLTMSKGSCLKLSGGGTILIGYGSYIQIGVNARLELNDCFINREVKIICNKEITIGTGTIIAMGTVIRDNDGGSHKLHNDEYENRKSVHIGKHVWIGENCFIMKGVTIGDGAVIGACSVVTRNIPAQALAVGNPAKVIRTNIEWEC